MGIFQGQSWVMISILLTELATCEILLCYVHSFDHEFTLRFSALTPTQLSYRKRLTALFSAITSYVVHANFETPADIPSGAQSISTIA